MDSKPVNPVDEYGGRGATVKVPAPSAASTIRHFAGELIERGPDLDYKTRLGPPGRWTRRAVFRLILSYHRHQQRVDRKLLRAIGELERQQSGSGPTGDEGEARSTPTHRRPGTEEAIEIGRSARELIERGPDPDYTTRTGWPGRFTRRVALRLISSYHLHQRRLDRELLGVLDELQHEWSTADTGAAGDDPSDRRTTTETIPLVRELIERGPVLDYDTPLGSLGRSARRAVFRLILVYHRYRQQVDRALLSAISEIDRICQQAAERRALARFVRDFGPPPCRRARARETPLFDPRSPPRTGLDRLEAAGGRRAGLCMVSICSVNYLHFGRTVMSSFRRMHPEARTYLVLADWDGEEPLEVEGTTLLAGRQIGGPHFDYMALKYSAIDLCSALKPWVIGHLIDHERASKLIYMDSDIYVFSRLDRLLNLLDEHDFVVTPHTFAPTPHPSRFWERPSLGDLNHAGVLNAGMMGVSIGAEAKRFVGTWREMVSCPGAFLTTWGRQTDQNVFNWITCFADNVAILRDASYNAAYWNLHDRSVRFVGLEENRTEESWEVDGTPLVAFHFSGFSPETPAILSKYDLRNSPLLLPSIARLIDFYNRQLHRHGAAQSARRRYQFEEFPSGIPIDAKMRELFERHETAIANELSPWTTEGEAYYCEALLSPGRDTTSLVPLLFTHIFDGRADLQALLPDAALCPGPLFHWIASDGIHEYGYQKLFDRYRPTLPTRRGALALIAAKNRIPEVFEGLEGPLTTARGALADRLERAGETDLALMVRHCHNERYFVSPVFLVRTLYESTEELAKAFPDVLFADSGRFASWLSEHAAEHFLPEGADEVFLERAEGRSLARVFSCLNRDWPLMRSWPLGLVGEGEENFARTLIATMSRGREYDLDDVAMYLWLMDRQPWVGVPLTLQLAVNVQGASSSFLAENQETLLAPVLHRHEEFGRALASYRQQYSDERHRQEEDQIRSLTTGDSPRSVFLLDVLGEARLEQPSAGACPPAGEDGPSRAGRPYAHATENRQATMQPAVPSTMGINLFGYYRSPIGLGHMTRGLASALTAGGVTVQKNLLGHEFMDRDVEPDDFLRTYDANLDTNVMISYPHIDQMLLHTLPKYQVHEKRNIVYLAWGQRDGSHYWPEIFSGFDQVWALSEFAKECFEPLMGRRVVTVPGVLDFGSFPAASAKEPAGLDPEKFAFLQIFDAGFIERNNPEAAIDAFLEAFSKTEPVSLILKVCNARPEHRDRLTRMLRKAADADHDVRVVSEDMPRRALLELISAVDGYLSLHRAEVFGWACAEAMAYAKPVVATGYSGNLQFMNTENSFLVDFDETGVEIPEGPFQRGGLWAEPNIEHAAQIMRSVYADHDRAHQIARRGHNDVRAGLSARAIAEIVTAALGERAGDSVREEGP